MVVTIKTKDVGDVKDCFRREIAYRRTPEDNIEFYIKRDLRIDDE